MAEMADAIRLFAFNLGTRLVEWGLRVWDDHRAIVVVVEDRWL